MAEASDAATKAVTNQHGHAHRCAQGMVEASNALMKAVTRQQQTDTRRCAQGMVEASGAVIMAVRIQHREAQGCAQDIAESSNRECRMNSGKLF